ncbi:MAG TPA: divalent-cation tolerance protein CutA [Terriglobia bacterium]|nr:divalent-cation tolerance protein CutA [Terriglobia bacterium]
MKEKIVGKGNIFSTGIKWTADAENDRLEQPSKREAWMTDKIVVLVTAGSLQESKKIARRLVESRLAACVNVTPPVQSIYRWQGKVAEDREFLLIIKTSRKRFAEVKSAVLKIHSYTTPEIISLPILDGSNEYLAWLDDSVRPSRGARGRA